MALTDRPITNKNSFIADIIKANYKNTNFQKIKTAYRFVSIFSFRLSSMPTTRFHSSTTKRRKLDREQLLPVSPCMWLTVLQLISCTWKRIYLTTSNFSSSGPTNLPAVMSLLTNSRNTLTKLPNKYSSTIADTCWKSTTISEKNLFWCILHNLSWNTMVSYDNINKIRWRVQKILSREGVNDGLWREPT